MKWPLPCSRKSLPLALDTATWPSGYGPLPSVLMVSCMETGSQRAHTVLSVHILVVRQSSVVVHNMLSAYLFDGRTISMYIHVVA